MNSKKERKTGGQYAYKDIKFLNHFILSGIAREKD